jgi:hypothetical protein
MARVHPALLCGPDDEGEPEMTDTRDLLVKEYEAVSAHLRANIGQFVNWFSFFLTFSFAALAVFVATGDRWPQPRLLPLGYAVPAVFLLMHLLAFAAILTFRHYSPRPTAGSARSWPRPGWRRRAARRSRCGSASG